MLVAGVLALLTAAATATATATAKSQSQHLWGPIVTSALSAGSGQDATPPTNDNAGSDDLTEEQRQQIELAGPILLNPSADIARSTRVGAARQLLAMGVEPAFAVLRQALASEEPTIMSAAIQAILDARRPVRNLQDDMIAALRTCPAPVLASLSQAIAQIGSPAITPVASIARDESLPVAERLGAIFALSEFRSRAAALELMELVSPGDGSTQASPEVFAASCQALTRMTGLSLGKDRKAWRDWWRSVKEMPAEQWLEMLLDNLSNQISDLQTQVAEHQQYRQSVEQRLIEAYRENLRSIPTTEGQLERIPALLDDALPGIRMIAIDRVAILLRDAVTLPPQFQQALIERLDDESAQVRTRVVALLDQMNVPTLVDEINARIANEPNTATIRAMVDVLARRQTPNTLKGLMHALDDPAVRQSALDGLWSVIATHREVITDHAEIIATLRGQLEQLRNTTDDDASHVRLTQLWARLLPEDRINEAVTLLDSDDAAVRSAVALSLAHRGIRQPLLQRSQDSAIFPHAVHVVVSGPGDLPNFRVLAGMSVPDGVPPTVWHDGLANLAAKLPASSLLEADDILQTITPLPAQVRIRVLERGVEKPAETLAADARATLIVRLASLLVSNNAAARAHQLLTQLNGSVQSSAELTDLRFFAAVRSGAFDAAAATGKSAEAWIAELQLLAANPDAIDLAKKLHADIMTRFSDSLTEAQLSTLGGINNALAGGNVGDESGQLPTTGNTVGG